MILMRTRLTIMLGSLSLLACLGGATQPTGGPPPANVRMAPVVERLVEQRRRVTGQTRAMRRSELASQEGGLVIELAVEAGSGVAQGDLIARLEPKRVELDLAEARAGVLTAQALIAERKAQSAQADLDLERVRELLELESGSRPELDRAQRDAAVEKARLMQAEAELEVVQAKIKIIEQRLTDLEIHAPFSGFVVRKMTEVGQWVRAGDPVVDLIEIAQIEIRIDVPETLIDRVSKSDTVWVHLPALNREVEAQVIQRVRVGDDRTRLFPVRLKADNADGTILPGMSAVALIPTSAKVMTTLVPKDAIVQGETGSFVYINREGVSAMAPIERLFAVGDEIAIRSPMLRPGMSVVVEGNERMFPGRPLIILNATSSTDDPHHTQP